jgi:hypothetical protein
MNGSWRAWRDSNPQPSDPKFVLIHNQLPQQRVRVRFGGLLPFFLSAHYLPFYLIVETTMETNFTGSMAWDLGTILNENER